jgi:hypothetical protein
MGLIIFLMKVYFVLLTSTESINLWIIKNLQEQ